VCLCEAKGLRTLGQDLKEAQLGNAVFFFTSIYLYKKVCELLFSSLLHRRPSDGTVSLLTVRLVYPHTYRQTARNEQESKSIDPRQHSITAVTATTAIRGYIESH